MEDRIASYDSWGAITNQTVTEAMATRTAAATRSQSGWPPADRAAARAAALARSSSAAFAQATCEAVIGGSLVGWSSCGVDIGSPPGALSLIGSA